MNFWFPAAFALLALGPLIVVLHMLRRRRQRLVVPSILLWASRDAATARRSGLGMVGNLLALLLSLLILILLVLALARPDASSWFRDQSTLVIVDSRARMQATGPGGERVFDQAVRIAEDFAHRASARHRVGLVFFPDGQIVPFSNNPKPLLDAIDSAVPTDASGDIVRAVDDIRTTGDVDKALWNVVVLTDREAPELEGEGTRVVALGSSRENVAITAFDSRPSATTPGTTDVFIRITNFGTEMQQISAGLRLDGTLIDATQSDIEPGGSNESMFSIPTRDLRQASTGVLTVELDGHVDAISSDNRASILSPTGETPRILLVSERDSFLEKAIAADREASFELLRPEAWNPAFVDAFAVVVFDGWSPADLSDDFLQAGNFFFVGSAPSEKSGPALINPPVTEIDMESPLLRGITLENLRVNSALALEPPMDAGWRDVITSGDKALLLTYQNPTLATQRSVILGFDPGASDLPSRIAFPLLVKNALDWLVGAESPPILIAGRNAPPKAGVYAAGQVPGLQTGAAVQLDARAESDLRGAGSSVAALTTEVANPFFPVFWKFLLVAAIIILMLEWVVYHRRWLT